MINNILDRQKLTSHNIIFNQTGLSSKYKNNFTALLCLSGPFLHCKSLERVFYIALF